MASHNADGWVKPGFTPKRSINIKVKKGDRVRMKDLPRIFEFWKNREGTVVEVPKDRMQSGTCFVDFGWIDEVSHRHERCVLSDLDFITKEEGEV